MQVIFRGREVTDQPERAIIATFAVAGALLGALVALAVAAILIPLSLPLHFIVRAFNGKGFIKQTDNGRYNYTVPPSFVVLVLVVLVLVVAA